MKKYVIIGNGTAAIGCVEGIRSIDKNAPITIVSTEKHHVYCRPLISYYLEGKTDTERMKYRPDDFYEKNGCTVLYGKTAKAIDRKEKKVLLDDKKSIAYDELCLATGSTPVIPKIPGADAIKNKFTFTTLDDALALEKALTKESKVLILGAGLIGLKCAEGLYNKVSQITVCDLADGILSSILDTDSAAMVQKHLESYGIRFFLKDSVTSFKENTATLKSGNTIDFDAVIFAVGSRANSELIKEIGGSCNRGITVDDAMKTSVEHIYAAGDCTESKDISDDTVKIMALMPNAYLQGYCAGVNMAGGTEKFDNAIPMNAIGFFGLHTLTAGTSTREGATYEEADKDHIKKLFTKDGKLTGFILIGEVERAGIYTNMIRNKIPLDSVDFDHLKKIPNLFAFAPEYRRKILGGVI